MSPALIDRLTGHTESDLSAVNRATTMRDAADRQELVGQTPTGWSVRFDIVYYGADTLTDVLIFRHERTRQELIVVPESNLDPTGLVRFYHSDRAAGTRRELPVQKGSLTEGLAYALDRIAQWSIRFDRRGTPLPSGAKYRPGTSQILD